MRVLRLRKLSGWTTTGVPIIIGFASVILIPVLLAILVGTGFLKISWGLLVAIQAAVAIGGIALSVPVYQLMMAKSPILDLALDGPMLTLSRRGKTVAQIDLSKPHRCAALVVLDLPAVKVFFAQGETEISFEQALFPPERLFLLQFSLATRRLSYYGDASYEFLPAGWKPGMTVQEGDLVEFLFAVAEFSENNETVPLIARRKG
jgi:hypothetical protein